MVEGILIRVLKRRVVRKKSQKEKDKWEREKISVEKCREKFDACWKREILYLWKNQVQRKSKRRIKILYTKWQSFFHSGKRDKRVNSAWENFIHEVAIFVSFPLAPEVTRKCCSLSLNISSGKRVSFLIFSSHSPNITSFHGCWKPETLSQIFFKKKERKSCSSFFLFKLQPGSIKSSLFTCSATTFCQEICLYPATEIKSFSLQSKFGVFIFKEAFHALLHIQPKKEFRVQSWFSLQRE